MIKLHRLNGQEIMVNSDLIESVEAVPDTLVVLYTGNKLVVKESVDELRELVIEFKKSSNAVPKIAEKQKDN